jgi:hypothetical protein
MNFFPSIKVVKFKVGHRVECLLVVFGEGVDDGFKVAAHQHRVIN